MIYIVTCLLLTSTFSNGIFVKEGTSNNNDITKSNRPISSDQFQPHQEVKNVSQQRVANFNNTNSGADTLEISYGGWQTIAGNQAQPVEASAQRRQSTGYTTSVVHGNGDQHAQSVIRVTFDHGETKPISVHHHQGPRQGRFNTALQPQQPVQYLQQTVRTAKPNPVIQYVQSNDIVTAPQNPTQSQGTFNVGYSIGFENTPTRHTPTNYAPTVLSPTQHTPSPNVQPKPSYRTNDIVTGTPKARVEKPTGVQNNYKSTRGQKPSGDSDAQSFVTGAMEMFKQNNIQLPQQKANGNRGGNYYQQQAKYTNSNSQSDNKYSSSVNQNEYRYIIPQNTQLFQSNLGNFKFSNFGMQNAAQSDQKYVTVPVENNLKSSSINSIQSTTINKVNQIPSAQKDTHVSYGWKNLSPGVEIASSSSGDHSENKPQQVQQIHQQIIHQPMKQQETGQQSYQLTQVNGHNGHFDHAQAIGNSQGFDYSNAMNYDQGLLPVGRAVSQHLPPVMNGGIEIDKTLLENFYKTYKPLENLNWMNNIQTPTGSSGNSFTNGAGLLLNQNAGGSFQTITGQNGGGSFQTITQHTGTPEHRAEPSTINLQKSGSIFSQSKPMVLEPVPIKMDTRLLAQTPILTNNPFQSNENTIPIQIDTSLLQKALANNAIISNGLLNNGAITNGAISNGLLSNNFGTNNIHNNYQAGIKPHQAHQYQVQESQLNVQTYNGHQRISTTPQPHYQQYHNQQHNNNYHDHQYNNDHEQHYNKDHHDQHHNKDQHHGKVHHDQHHNNNHHHHHHHRHRDQENSQSTNQVTYHGNGRYPRVMSAGDTTHIVVAPLGRNDGKDSKNGINMHLRPPPPSFPTQHNY